MLKHIKFSGIFHDDNLSVHVTLENPLDYGLEVTTLVFSVTVKAKSNTDVVMGDFAFFIIDEAGCMYDAKYVSTPTITTDIDEPEQQPDGLILTDFKHEFLYQDLRIAFKYRPYQSISIIELNY